jgi:hypothetical protein
MDEVFQIYLWDGVSPHEFLMTLAYILSHVKIDQELTYIDSTHRPFSDMPTITERAVDCVCHFLEDQDIVRQFEDEGIVHIQHIEF